MLIRRCGADDNAAAIAVHADAFRRPGAPGDVPPEVTLFVALLDAGDVIDELSLVAIEGGRVIGHVVCSRATVDDVPVAAPGPVAVRSTRQRAGVGSALVNSALAAADALCLPLVGLLGSTAYYPRFGFVPAASVGIEPPDFTWGDHFQVRLLRAYQTRIRGRFRRAPAFDGSDRAVG